MQCRVQFTLFQFNTLPTANKLHFTTMALCQLLFVLHFRAFVRLCIEQWTQTFKLALAQGQQWPQTITAY
ncbi:hypothetical protein D3C80_1991560 [compost metagenome]